MNAKWTFVGVLATVLTSCIYVPERESPRNRTIYRDSQPQPQPQVERAPQPAPQQRDDWSLNERGGNPPAPQQQRQYTDSPQPQTEVVERVYYVNEYPRYYYYDYYWYDPWWYPSYHVYYGYYWGGCCRRSCSSVGIRFRTR